jgi:plastocyanin
MARAALVAVSLAVAISAVLAATPAAAAAERTFTLYADVTWGWGASPSTLRMPGPTLTVDVGDNITFTLNASDGANHNWFLDYNNDSNDDADEPDSPNFKDEQIAWTFTADRNGTFVYRCRFHPAMAGTILVRDPSAPTGTQGAPDRAPLVAALAVSLAALAGLFGYVLYDKKQTPARRDPRKP